MAYSSKLCNPTPFPAKLNWSCGINIRIEPFGSADLTMQQMDDFRDGKPGSAAVKSVLDHYGLFLYDTDRPYDNQALEALKRSVAAKKSQYNAGYQNLVDRRSAAGIAPDKKALESTLEQMGFVRLRNEIETLQKGIKILQKAVGNEPEQMRRAQYDPARTLFFTDPPKEFPSVAAMNFFLDENPDIKAKHEAFKERDKAPTSDTAEEALELRRAFKASEGENEVDDG